MSAITHGSQATGSRLVARPTNDALAVEHEIQRQMLERLGIEWTPGEPFYALVEGEIERLESEVVAEHELNRQAMAGIERLRATLMRLRASLQSNPGADRMSLRQARDLIDETLGFDPKDGASTQLRVIPWQVDATHYSLMIVLQEGNIERLREYDPVEVPLTMLGPKFAGLQLRDVTVTYATDEDIREVERLGQQGDIRGALRYLTRGFRFRPDRGDHDNPWQHLQQRLIDLKDG